jgi:hypothetical protein
MLREELPRSMHDADVHSVLEVADGDIHDSLAVAPAGLRRAGAARVTRVLLAKPGRCAITRVLLALGWGTP